MTSVIENLERQYNISSSRLSRKSRIDWNNPSLSKIPGLSEFSIKTSSAPLEEHVIEEAVVEETVEQAQEPVKKQFDFEALYGRNPDYQSILNSLVEYLKETADSNSRKKARAAKEVINTLNTSTRITSQDVIRLAKTVWLMQEGNC